MRDSIYAAYGSNLNFSQMAMRCPDAKVLTTARLDGYELVFRGNPHGAVATIEPREGSSVPILLWTISKKDEQALDRYEGYPSFYGKQSMTFQAEGQDVSAMVYVMTPGHLAGSPSRFYLNTIMEGYQDCGFDPAPLKLAMRRSHELMEQEATYGHQFTLY